MQLVVGRIVRPHGVRGEVVVDVRTDSPDERYAVGTVFVTEPAAAGPLTVSELRPHQGRLLVTFEGIADRDIADALRGVLLCVDSADVPEPDDPDEFLDHQLVGLRAESPDGESIGEGLVPFVRAIVPTVDVAGGRVVLTPPDGLFDV
jgi:16S rRNA processing protein RimM